MADHEERLTERLMVQLSPGIYGRSMSSAIAWSARRSRGLSWTISRSVSRSSWSAMRPPYHRRRAFVRCPQL